MPGASRILGPRWRYGAAWNARVASVGSLRPFAYQSVAVQSASPALHICDESVMTCVHGQG